MDEKAKANFLALLAKAQAQQVDMLNKLRDRVNSGAEIPPTPVDIVPVNEVDQFEESPDRRSTGDWVAFIRLLSELQTRDPLSHWASLQQAADQNWLLSTAEVEQLIGTKPRLSKKNPVFVRGSFIFTPSGKIGNMRAWRISKIE